MRMSNRDRLKTSEWAGGDGPGVLLPGNKFQRIVVRANDGSPRLLRTGDNEHIFVDSTRFLVVLPR